MKHDERVLVIPAAQLDLLGRFQGFSPDADRYIAGLLVPEFMDYRPRSEVEEDPGYKQIIPYVVFRSRGSVFCYTRGKSQGEARLHRLRSLGVGGHVSIEDAGGGRSLDAYESALRRELDEEVAITSEGRIGRVGLINDDSTPVGRVHLGVVHLYELNEPGVTPREDGLADAGFLDLDTIRQLRGEFETWSQICIDALLGGD
ncbi:MAG: phosphoesterase [Isosphaeraceae bacterium]